MTRRIPPRQHRESKTGGRQFGDRQFDWSRRATWLLLGCGVLGVAALAVYLRWAGRPLHDTRRTGGSSAISPSEAFPGPDPKWGAVYREDATPADLRNEARRVADEVAARYPDVAAALAVQAQQRSTVGENEEAVEIWRRCLTLDPRRMDAHLDIGTFALRRGELSEAVESLRRARELDPADARVAITLAAALVGLGQTQEAVTLLEPLVAEGRSTVEGLILLGQGYQQLKQYAKAKQVFGELLQRTPDEPKAHFGLARACLLLGEREEANRHLEECRRLEGLEVQKRLESAHGFSDPQTARGLLVALLDKAARVYLDQNDEARAEEMWRKAAVLDVTHAESRRALLALYENQDRLRDCLRVCEELTRIEPGNPVYWYNVGVLSGQLERYDVAVAAARRALQLDPHNPQYQVALEMIEQGAAR